MAKKSKKILVDLERMRYPNSGLSNVCEALVKGFEKLGFIDSLSFYGEETIISNLKIKNKEFWKPWNRIFNPVVKKYDFVHITHQVSSYFPNCKKPKIVTLHDLNFLHEGKSKKKIAKEIKRINKSLKNTKYLICISEFTKQDFLNNKALFKYPKDMCIEVIHNGLIFEDFETDYSEKLTFLEDKEFLLNIGVIHPKKNQLSLLSLLVDNPDIYLVLVFSNKKADYESLIIKKSKELGIYNRILFFENIEEKQKIHLLKNCKALVHPSKAEGFGIPPIEAMYFEKPVFVSNLTSLPEIAGKEAYYWKSFDSKSMSKVFKEGIKDYDNDSQKRQRLKKWALKYDYLEMARKYIELYKKI
ncbi:Glycosyltransferase involved in cell wall bisynthesis [Tenacibaculum sp. 190524A02b]|uniref:glycosyltransferase family 4 protein n=1 Tax=Tenacibaculum vairaonense TaxID=3137860 RepID=UPI0032B117A7